jgi:hypothetical protein
MVEKLHSLIVAGIQRQNMIQAYQKYDNYGNIANEKSLRQSWSSFL